jgi:hypothetical protein
MPNTTKGYSGKIPTPAYMAFEKALTGIEHGVVSLVFHIRGGRLSLYRTTQDISHKPEEQGEAEGGSDN